VQAITVRREIGGRVGIPEEEGIMELLGREFSAMVEGRHAGQPSTSDLTMENSMMSLGRQGNYLAEQAAMKVLSPGSKFIAYSTKLSKKVVSRVESREATTKHREEVGTRDKAPQAVIASSRSQGII